MKLGSSVSRSIQSSVKMSQKMKRKKNMRTQRVLCLIKKGPAFWELVGLCHQNYMTIHHIRSSVHPRSHSHSIHTLFLQHSILFILHGQVKPGIFYIVWTSYLVHPISSSTTRFTDRLISLILTHIPSYL